MDKGSSLQARRYRDRLGQHSLIDELSIQDESELIFLRGQDLCEADSMRISGR